MTNIAEDDYKKEQDFVQNEEKQVENAPVEIEPIEEIMNEQCLVAVAMDIKKDEVAKVEASPYGEENEFEMVQNMEAMIVLEHNDLAINEDMDENEQDQSSVDMDEQPFNFREKGEESNYNEEINCSEQK